MSRKIYVGNMNYNTNEQSLATLFEQYGPVESVNIIIDRDTGNSKGFGFVEMESEEAAEAAIFALNAKEFEGRQLRVNEAIARNRNDRPQRNDYYRY